MSRMGHLSLSAEGSSPNRCGTTPSHRTQRRRGRPGLGALDVPRFQSQGLTRRAIPGRRNTAGIPLPETHIMLPEQESPRAASRRSFLGQRPCPRCSWFVAIALLAVLSGRLDADFGFPPEPQPWTKTWPLEDIDVNGDGIRDFQLILLKHWPGDYQSYDWIAFRLAPTRGNSVVMNVKTRTDGSTYHDAPVPLADGFEMAVQLPSMFAWESEERSLLSFDDPWSPAEPLSDFKGPLHETESGILGVQFAGGDGSHFGWVRLQREDLDAYPWFKIHVREVGC